MSAKGTRDDAFEPNTTPIPLNETWVISWSLAGWLIHGYAYSCSGLPRWFFRAEDGCREFSLLDLMALSSSH